MSIDRHHLTALAAIVRGGSFEAAAASLGVTPSAVSQRIKALEERMGTALIYRGQPCTPTDAGTRLARHSDDVALMEAHVLRSLQPDAALATPRVRIAVNADSLATWFVSALAEVPDLLFDLVIDDQDTSTDWLLRGAVSGAVTAQDQPVSGCTARPLGALRYVATASPGFAQKWFPNGVTVQALEQAPMMTFNVKDRLQHGWITKQTGEKLSPPTHQLPSTHAFVDAACAGLGWGMNPLSLVETHLKDGRLVELAPENPLDIALYWQTSRLMAPALAPLSTAIAHQARLKLIDPSHGKVKPKQ